MKPTAPDFLIAGAPRSGTTALSRYLSQHPRLSMCRPKEPHYLALGTIGPNFKGPGDDETINANSVLTLGEYVSVLHRARSEGPIVGDGSVTSFYHWPLVEQTLAEQFIGVPRVLVMLRDPVDRAFSSYLYQRRRGFETHTFERGLELEENRRAGGYQHMWHYRGAGRYGQQLQTLLQSVGADRVKVIIFEEFQANTLAVVDEVATWLTGQRWDFSEVDRINRSGEPRSFALAATAARLRRNRLTRIGIRAITTESMRTRMTGSLTTYPELAPDLRHRLAAEFAIDRQAVYSHLGRRIEAWSPAP